MHGSQTRWWCQIHGTDATVAVRIRSTIARIAGGLHPLNVNDTGLGGQPAAAPHSVYCGRAHLRQASSRARDIHINKVRHHGDRLSTDALVFRYAQEKLAAARVVRLVGRGSSSTSGLLVRKIGSCYGILL